MKPVRQSGTSIFVSSCSSVLFFLILLLALTRTLKTLRLVLNDLGRGPKGCGEKGRDTDDEDDDFSDGEGGNIDGGLASDIAKARGRRKKHRKPTDNEDATGRPIGLTQVEAERGQGRQRWAVNHTVRDVLRQLREAGVGGPDGRDEHDLVSVLIDPPNTDKLSFKPNELQERAGSEIKGTLAKLRHDLNQVQKHTCGMSEGRGCCDPPDPLDRKLQCSPGFLSLWYFIFFFCSPFRLTPPRPSPLTPHPSPGDHRTRGRHSRLQCRRQSQPSPARSCWHRRG